MLPPDLAAALADPALPWLLATVAVGGLVRGFAGFGAAMVFMPVGAALVGPKTALVSLWLADMVGSVPLVLWAVRHATWKEPLRLAAGALVGSPLGVWTLTVLPVVTLRWAISLATLFAVTALASGWRYAGGRGVAATTAVGLAGGFVSGVSGLVGSVMTIFYIGRGGGAVEVKANMTLFFLLSGVIALGPFLWHGLVTAQTLAFGALMAPVYLAAIRLGASLFDRTSESLYRRFAYAVILASALAGLPLFD